MPGGHAEGTRPGRDETSLSPRHLLPTRTSGSGRSPGHQGLDDYDPGWSWREGRGVVLSGNLRSLWSGFQCGVEVTRPDTDD